MLGRKSFAYIFSAIAIITVVLVAGCRHKTNTIPPAVEQPLAMQYVDSTNVTQLLLAQFSGWTGKDSNFVEWKPADSSVNDLNSISTEPGVLLNDQGYCRTRIDSTFSMQINGSKYLVQLLSTYGMVSDTQVMDCHACSPALGVAIFKVGSGNKLLPVRYKPFITAYGNSGEGGNVALVKYGDNKYALQVSSSNTAQGYTNVSTGLFELDGFKKIITYEAHNDNAGAAIDESMAYANDCIPHFSNEDGKIKLTLICDGTTMRTRGRKIVPFHSQKVYVYDEDQKEFIQEEQP